MPIDCRSIKVQMQKTANFSVNNSSRRRVVRQFVIAFSINLFLPQVLVLIIISMWGASNIVSQSTLRFVIADMIYFICLPIDGTM